MVGLSTASDRVIQPSASGSETDLQVLGVSLGAISHQLDDDGVGGLSCAHGRVSGGSRGSPGDEEDDPERLPGDREERDGRSEAVKLQPKNTAAVIAREKELPCVGCVEKADARQLFPPRDDGGSVLRLHRLHGLGAAIALFTIAREPLRVIFLIAG
ncbi:hypothetical protein EYF80_058141 [Liparis tanakae]|uniref:Uncharacterized protein n=1 Tax=Liparis tanakae TaxID=230148 RepID=A0A4Z2ESB4_9TELE|nr:hypothetical protein EYF80_058141 [Liparis tanakae]